MNHDFWRTFFLTAIILAFHDSPLSYSFSCSNHFAKVSSNRFLWKFSWKVLIFWSIYHLAIAFKVNFLVYVFDISVYLSIIFFVFCVYFHHSKNVNQEIFKEEFKTFAKEQIRAKLEHFESQVKSTKVKSHLNWWVKCISAVIAKTASSSLKSL